MVRGRIDPALLEYASGNTFRGRVFPIPPKGYNRVILAYEETLPVTEARLLYRFSLPTCKLHELRFTLQADPRAVRTRPSCPKTPARKSPTTLVAFSKTWSDTTPSGEVVFSAKASRREVQSTSGRHGEGGPLYLYARLRPELPKIAKEEPFAKHAVFLLDTSLSEHPDRFAVSMKLLKAILEADSDIEQFNVLASTPGRPGWTRRAGCPTPRPAAKHRPCPPRRIAAGRRHRSVRRAGEADRAGLRGGEGNAAGVLPAVRRPPDLGPDGGGSAGGEVPQALRAAGAFLLLPHRPGRGERRVVRRLDARRRRRLPVLRRGRSGRRRHGTPPAVSAGRARPLCRHPDVSEVLVAGRRAAVYPGGELIVAGQFPKAARRRWSWKAVSRDRSSRSRSAWR